METPPGKHSLGRLLKATRYSWQGAREAFRTEAAFREEIYAALIMIPFALWIDVSGVERALLIASVLFVIIVELLNTAVEVVVDRISPEHHALSGHAKDLGSAAVLTSLMLAFSTWTCVLVPHYF
ncbi:MAG: diacylglycerol kinase [Pseudomonadota bacterium]